MERLPRTNRRPRTGDYVYFGAYEQDNNTENGMENVEWLVLDKQDGKVFVVSKYCLDCQPYDSTYTDITWENCILREWLNGEFINNAFSAVEQAAILDYKITNPDNEELKLTAAMTQQTRCSC